MFSIVAPFASGSVSEGYRTLFTTIQYVESGCAKIALHSVSRSAPSLTKRSPLLFTKMRLRPDVRMSSMRPVPGVPQGCSCMSDSPMSSAPAASASLRPSPWAQGFMFVQPMESSSFTSAQTPVLTSWRYETFAPKPPVAMTTAGAFTVTSRFPRCTALTPLTAPFSTRSSLACISCSIVIWSGWSSMYCSNDRM